MNKYPKIKTVDKRDSDTHKLIEGVIMKEEKFTDLDWKKTVTPIQFSFRAKSLQFEVTGYLIPEKNSFSISIYDRIQKTYLISIKELEELKFIHRQIGLLLQKLEF